MNWLGLLKNKAGKLVINTSSALAVSAGIGVIAVSLMQNVASEQIKKQSAVRSLSSISNAYNYGGLQRSGREGLTSINVKDGLNQVATAEERARLEGARTGGGDFGLSAADNLGNTVGASIPGSAAKTSASEGLGMGGNEAMDLSAATSGNGSASGVGGAANGAALQGAAGRASAGNSQQLGSASMARASGTGITNTASSGTRSFGDISSGSGGGSSSSSGEGYKFSGSMPSGTNPFSLGEAAGRGRSSGLGGAHNSSSFGGSGRFKNTGNELKDVSQMTAKVAANSNRSANEASRPLFAPMQLSGGMSIEEKGVDALETGSTDFFNAQLPQIDNSIEKTQKTLTNQENDFEKDVTRLVLLAVGLFLTTLVLMEVAAWLLSMGDAAWWVKGLGYLALAAICAFAWYVSWQAEEFFDKWNGIRGPLWVQGTRWFAQVIVGLSFGAAAFTAIKPKLVHEKSKELLAKLKETQPGLGKKLAWTVAKPVVKEGVQMGKEKFYEDSYNDKNNIA